MPIFHVNFNTKPGSQALGNLQRNGNELVKAMQLKDRADSQQVAVVMLQQQQMLDQIKVVIYLKIKS